MIRKYAGRNKVLYKPAGYFYIILFLIAVSVFINISNNGYAEPLKAINSPDYGVEEDAMEMIGRVIGVEKWTNFEYANLDNHLFEPVKVTIKVCKGPRTFYVKKGIDTSLLKKDNILEFIMNKNTCDEDKKFVIMKVYDCLGGEKQ